MTFYNLNLAYLVLYKQKFTYRREGNMDARSKVEGK